MSEPLVIKNENVRPFDVDGCLIVRKEESTETAIVIDPVDITRYIEVGINLPMVRLLEEEFQRGSYIEVWSRSGWEWAYNVIDALGLLEKVHVIKSKPIVYFDNEPVENWLKDRVFIGPDVPYKR